MMRLMTTTLAATLALGGAAAAQDDRQIPLMAVEGDEDRDYYLIEQMNREGELEALREIVGSPAVPLAVEQDGPIQIALVYPSADVSDFWARMYLAFTKRLDELGIEYETTEFASRQIEHSLQSTYTDQ